MRTIFTAADKAEDGFVFLSDAFIRQLTGQPAGSRRSAPGGAYQSESVGQCGAVWRLGKT